MSDLALAQVIDGLCRRDPEFAETLASQRLALTAWEQEGVLAPGDLAGRRVLDWECGKGVFSAIFLEAGAAEVVGIDQRLDPAWFAAGLGGLPAVQFLRTPFEEWARKRPAGTLDLIFGNTASEHALDLAAVLTHCDRLLAPGGLLVLNHDNYYHPAGSHDYGFLGYHGRGIAFLGPRCWDRREKCAASQDFRRELAERYPWTWDERTESRRDPRDCSRCPYYRRAQPWAHLLYREEFREVFPQPCFTTGYPGSSLNKVTPFLLRQYLVEAGFEIARWVPHRLDNRPPRALLEPPFGLSADDLVTATIAIRARKAAEPAYWDLPPFPGRDLGEWEE